MPYFIYALVDPRTNIIGYIGITDQPENRYYAHLGCKERNKNKNTWIRNIKGEGFKPEMRVLDTADDKDEALEKEEDWIKLCIEQGIKLTNIIHVTKRKRRILKKPASQVPQVDERTRVFFRKLDEEWELMLFVNKPLTATKLPKLLRRYTWDLEIRFPSKRDLIPLWIASKQRELNKQIEYLRNQGQENHIDTFEFIDYPYEYIKINYR